jgi:hypothetical protein
VIRDQLTEPFVLVQKFVNLCFVRILVDTIVAVVFLYTVNQTQKNIDLFLVLDSAAFGRCKTDLFHLILFQMILINN